MCDHQRCAWQHGPVWHVATQLDTRGDTQLIGIKLRPRGCEHVDGQVGEGREDPCQERLLVHVLRAHAHHDKRSGVARAPREVDRRTVRVLLEERTNVHDVLLRPASRVELGRQDDELELAPAL